MISEWGINETITEYLQSRAQLIQKITVGSLLKLNSDPSVPSSCDLLALIVNRQKVGIYQRDILLSPEEEVIAVMISGKIKQHMLHQFLSLYEDIQFVNDG